MFVILFIKCIRDLKMYIYELPFEINKELCRLLDHDNDWKELAGNFMKYSAFDVNVSIYVQFINMIGIFPNVNVIGPL